MKQTNNNIKSPEFSAPESMINHVFKRQSSLRLIEHLKWGNSNTVKNDIHFTCKQGIMIYTYI